MAMTNIDITIVSGDNYIMFEGKKIPLTDEQIKILKGTETPKEVKKNPFERQLHHRYYYITTIGKVDEGRDKDWTCDDNVFSVANYCTDKKLTGQRALHETLNRLLWRFSMENGEGENLWDGDHLHYFIYYNSAEEYFDVSNYCIYRTEGTTYFPSDKLARRAINEIVRPFMKEHPDFVW